jgi:hypothetical protein
MSTNTTVIHNVGGIRVGETRQTEAARVGEDLRTLCNEFQGGEESSGKVVVDQANEYNHQPSHVNSNDYYYENRGAYNNNPNKPPCLR